MRFSDFCSKRVAVLAISALGVVSARAAAQDGGVASLIIISPAAEVARAKNPAPPANAQKKAMIGKAATMLHTNQSTQDLDSYWSERIDVDGDGNAEESDWLWDDETKVLYTFSDASFRCAGGGTGNGGMLVAVYGVGNTHGRPSGSGWWVANLENGECNAKVAGLQGCRFNSAGRRTQCGVAMIDDKNGDVVIGTAKVAKP